ncbi:MULTISPECIES: tyrosine-type recombinase/integrase [Pseudonocardiaceae]|uniref:tyrosine-type recombinase/integrase n=1 Tax=Pseudonocardiaceae TaxID=2070 RepID=UPI0018F4896C|nr:MULTISPECIES: tyrosine-type recombinase/integrase [Pseudonocardiaceae]
MADNVIHLDPAPAVFEAMLEGWRRQQSARFLKTSLTIAPRLRLIRRLWDFTGLYPWQWTPADGEAFIDDMRGGESPIVASTARTYEVAISLFLEYLLDSRYGWVQVCEERFGDTPQQVFHEGNSVLHKLNYEGDPRRRPLTYDEVQALFDAADARPGTISGRGRKGALCAARDAAVLKTVYAFGLRRRETSRVDLADLRRNRKAPQFGDFGTVMVRYGKAPKGSPPKRRTVLLVPEMDWVVDTLADWVSQMRPRFAPGSHPALWVTERVGRLSPRSINEAFVAARDDAGLDPSLDLHCLRHSYITHLTEFGYPARFVQEQVGHAFGSTTAIYMGVSNEYRNKLLEAALKGRLGEDWE